MASMQDYIDSETAALLASKEADAQLSAYTSPSATARWYRLIVIFAQAAAFLRTLWDQLKLDVEAQLAEAAKAGPLAWYAQKALEFQYAAGVIDILVRNPTTLAIEYQTIAPERRLITRCSVRTLSTNTLEIKVAKGPDTALAAVTGPELAAFTAYINRLKFPGNLSVVSLPPDQLRVTASITYDGTVPLAALQTAVSKALDDFLAALNSSENFGGIVYRSRLAAAIRAVPGVIDCVISGLVFRPSDVSLGDSSILPAGYAIIEAGSLATSLTYTASSPY
jgi:hypothetical protein